MAAGEVNLKQKSPDEVKSIEQKWRYIVMKSEKNVLTHV